MNTIHCTYTSLLTYSDIPSNTIEIARDTRHTSTGI
jgi:hypothetical protein